MENSKQHLTDAFSKLQDAQIELQQALNTIELQNNKRGIQNTLNMVTGAIYVASNAVSNYQESDKN